MDNLHRIVSSENEELILVDAEDNVTGYGSKAECHEGAGVMHRAFSLFLFNDDGELLLQQRGKDKRLWPGFWSNSCCSHPRRGETLATATARRLSDELNISAELEYVYQFCYEALFSEAGSENELCHVFLGKVDGEIRPNDSEIDSVRYVSATDLDAEFVEHPERFTPWFKKEWQSLRSDYADPLGRYAI